MSSSKPLLNMASTEARFGVLYVEELYIGKGTISSSFSSPFMTEGQLSDVVIVGGVIDAVAIGMTTPAPASFTDITSGKEGSGEYTVLFHGNSPGEYMKWSGLDSQLTVNGRMVVRDGITLGNLSVTRNTLLGTGGVVQLSVPGQSLGDYLLKPGYLHFSGPISQQNTTGAVSLYSHTRELPGGLFLSSATQIGLHSAGTTWLKSKYNDVCLSTESPVFSVIGAEKREVLGGDGLTVSRLQLQTVLDNYALEGVFDGDLVEISSRDTLPVIDGQYTVYNVNVKTGVFQINWNGDLPVHSATSSTSALCSFKKVSSDGGRVFLNASKAVVIPSEKPLNLDGCLGKTSLVNSAGNVLTISSRSGIRLIPETGFINIPNNIPLSFGAGSGQFLISSGSDVDMSASGTIHLTPGTSVTLPSGKAVVFGQPGEYIVGNSNMTVNSSGGQVNVQAKTDIILSAQLGTILLNSAVNVRIPSGTPLILGSTNTVTPATLKYDQLANSLDITCVSRPINITCSKLQLPDNSPILFGTSSSQSTGEIRSDAAQSTFIFKVSTAQITPGVTPSIQLDAPLTVVTGDLTVMGAQTTVNSTIQIIDDPVLQLGSHINTLDAKDRGISFLYGVDKIGFFGFKQSSGKLTFIPDCTGYANDVFTGQPGSMDVGELAVGSMSGDPDLVLNAKSGYIIFNTPMGAILPVGMPLYFGANRASFISAQTSPQTLTLSSTRVLVSSGTLQLTNSGPTLNGTSDGVLYIKSDEIRLGQTGDVVLAVVPSVNSRALFLSNLNSLGIPANTTFNMGNSASMSSNETNTIFSSSVPLKFQVNGHGMYVDGEIRQATWAGETLSLAVGGTNKTTWTHGCIPYVDRPANAAGAFAETVNLVWDASAMNLQLGGSLYSNHSITPRMTDGDGGLFSIAGMIHAYAAAHVVQIGASPSANTLPVDVDLRVLARAWMGSTVYISSETETIYRTTSATNAAYGDLNFSATGCVHFRAPYGIGTGTASEALRVNNTLNLSSPQYVYSWAGHPSESISLSPSTNTVNINSAGDVNLNSGGEVLLNDGCGLKWANATLGVNAPVILNESERLRIKAPSVTFNAESSLEFTDKRRITSTPSGFFMQDGDTIYLQAPNIHIDGNVTMQGNSIFTGSPSIALDPAVIVIGGGTSTNISSIVNANMNNDGHVRIRAMAVHYLSVGDQVTVTMSNSQPDVDGVYTVFAVIDSQTIEIVTTYSTLSVTGNSGYLKTAWKTDPGKDSGLQINYFNSTAFMGRQHSSGRFILASTGISTTDTFQVGSYGDLQIRALYVNEIPGFTLTGPLYTGTSLVSGSNFRASGGSFVNVSVDQWTTSTTTVIANLNADRLQGLQPADLVLVNGSNPLIADWHAGNQRVITCGNVGLDALSVNKIPYVAPDKTLATASGMYFIPGTETLVTNVDVSSKTLTLAPGQIPGSKIGPGTAGCDISGNAETTTNAVYTTDYNDDFCILVANSANVVESLKVPAGCMIGRVDNEPTGKLSAIPLPTFTLPSTRVSVMCGHTVAISVAYSLTYVSVVRSPGSPQTEAHGTLAGASEDGITRVIYVRLEEGSVFLLSLNFSSADGTTGLRQLLFDRSGQSVYLGYDSIVGSWWAIQSGATVI